MLAFILALAMLFSAADSDGGPVVETCAFLPADHPCHFNDDPPPETCQLPGGPVEVCP